ncbi:MAG: hypothetical protein KI792_11560 [Alphaproteobacteria bacterium]|nr:hypothetical protein [Alphaproteobacteria bacterium SS10]
MPTSLPIDSQGNAIPALRPRPGAAHEIAVTSSSARNSTAFAADTQVIGVFSSVPAKISLGDSSVSATSVDHFVPAGQYLFFSIGMATRGQASHLAVIATDGDGTLYISELD